MGADLEETDYMIEVLLKIGDGEHVGTEVAVSTWLFGYLNPKVVLDSRWNWLVSVDP
jgi:hypothetical protein